MDKILVNIDFKYDNAGLLDKAILLAKQHSAVIELFNCCYNRGITQGYMFDKAAEQKAEHAYIRQTEAKLEALSERVEAAGVKVSFDVCWERHQVEGVMRKVLRFEPDLLIHGVQSHRGIGHYLFAPIDWLIARKSPVPVLFVKQKPWKDILRIAACVDPFHQGDEHGEVDKVILKKAQTFITDNLSEQRVLHCFNTLPHEAIFDEHMVTDYAALQERVEKEHVKRCNRLLAEFGLSVDSELVDIIKGEAESVISQYAEQKGIDVLVMGAVARGMFDRLLLGSTMEKVVDDVDCDVLIVKGPDFKCPVVE